MSEREESIRYRVVVNHEEQYSIWPADKENASGWRDAGFDGSKADALAYINEHWTDMRPLSLRQHMERDQAASQQPVAVAAVSPAPAAAAAVPVMAGAAPEAATPATAGTSVAEAEAKQKRGWFGRQRDEAPAPATAAPEATEDPKQKRGWFGRR